MSFSLPQQAIFRVTSSLDVSPDASVFATDAVFALPSDAIDSFLEEPLPDAAPHPDRIIPVTRATASTRNLDFFIPFLLHV